MAVIRVSKNVRESGVLRVTQSADKIDELIRDSQVNGHEFIEVNEDQYNTRVRIKRGLIQSYE